jgi:hypothetical protein
VSTVRSSLLLFLGVLAVLACSSKPPKPRIVRGHRKHPKKSADTIPLGPPAILENDPVVICARRFVRAIIDSDQSTVEALISPAWLSREEISIDSFVVSRLETIEVPPHSPYMITDVRGDTVTVLATTERGFSRYLTVRISSEDGKYYVVPGGADTPCQAIDPWTWPPDPDFILRRLAETALDTMHRERPAIREDDPVVICARRFARAMIDDDHNTYEALISPKWLKETGRSLDTFMVSKLGLVEVPAHSTYLVTDVKSDAVTIMVTNERGYSRCLTVRVSEEDGRSYIVPSGADDCCGSIDPWTWPPDP